MLKARYPSLNDRAPPRNRAFDGDAMAPCRDGTKVLPPVQVDTRYSLFGCQVEDRRGGVRVPRILSGDHSNLNGCRQTRASQASICVQFQQSRGLGWGGLAGPHSHHRASNAGKAEGLPLRGTLQVRATPSLASEFSFLRGHGQMGEVLCTVYAVEEYAVPIISSTAPMFWTTSRWIISLKALVRLQRPPFGCRELGQVTQQDLLLPDPDHQSFAN